MTLTITAKDDQDPSNVPGYVPAPAASNDDLSNITDEYDDIVAEIKRLVALIKAKQAMGTEVGVFTTVHLMSVMGAYSNERVKAQGLIQDKLNGLVDRLKEAWNTLNDADKPGADAAALKAKMEACMDGLKTEIDALVTDRFSPLHDNQDLANTMKGGYDNIKSLAADMPQMWKDFEAGNTAKMDSMMRDLGQSNEEVTSNNNQTGTTIKVETQLYTALQQTLTSIFHMINTINTGMSRNSKVQ